MAIAASVVPALQQNSPTAGSTFVMTSAGGLGAGSWAVAIVAVDNEAVGSDSVSNTVTGITDTQGNAWEKMHEYTNVQGGDSSGACVAGFLGKLTNTLATGTDQITVQFASSRGSKAVCIGSFTVAAGKKLQLDGVSQNATDAADPPSMTVTGSSSVSRLNVRGVACETNNTTWTKTGAYTSLGTSTTTGGGGAANMKVGGEYIIETVQTSTASNPTANNVDNASIMFSLIEVADETTGTVASTLGGITCAATGTEVFTGTEASTLGGVSVSASGENLLLSGTVAATLGGITCAATGTETFTGTSAATLTTAAISGAGTEVFTGTAAATLGGIAQSASGLEIFTGTASATLGGASIEAAGDVSGGAITGTCAATLTGIACAATGLETFTGTTSANLTTASIAGSGTLVFTGTASATLGGASITASGATVEGIAGDVAATLGSVSIAASGTEVFAGAAAATTGSPSISADALEVFTGVAGATLGGASVTSSGDLTYTAALASILGGISVSAAGVEAFLGTIAVTLSGPTLAASGIAGALGTPQDPLIVGRAASMRSEVAAVMASDTQSIRSGTQTELKSRKPTNLRG